MGSPLNRITIRGFKSIQSLEAFELRNLNVLIGANGAGKSNFVEFFRMIRAMADEALQKFVNEQGGGDGMFFDGPQVTRQISARMEFGQNVYEFDLAPTPRGLQIASERVQYTGGARLGRLTPISKGKLESVLKKSSAFGGSMGARHGVEHYVHDAVSGWTVYHFHDTGLHAPMRREQSARDYERLNPDASNLAAYMLRLRDTAQGNYELIRDTVRLMAPFFDDFLFRSEEKAGEEKLRLEWKQKGSNFPFQPVHLSDGTIRFICLATALMQPDPPAAIVIDEPELGLHPYAISLLADLIKSAATRTQVIVSTQSPQIVDHLQPEDVIVVNRAAGGSTFERLDAAQLGDWLRDYSLGELWQKNVVRGGPNSE